ncbi:hypothetical protein BLSTO_06567 [Blastocystis sp. subtype 1]
MTNELMKDPVMLPNSKMVLDRSTIERLLMEKPVDPYDRTPLTKEQLIPQEELRQRIQQWKVDNNYSL